MQKLLQTSLFDWTKKTTPPTNTTMTTTLPPTQPATSSIQHNNILNDNASASSFDHVLFAEDLNVNENTDTVLPQAQQTVDSHTNEQYFKCKLIKLLDEATAPHFLFQEAVHNGYSFQPKQITQNAHIAQSITILLSSSDYDKATCTTKQSTRNWPHHYIQLYCTIIIYSV